MIRHGGGTATAAPVVGLRFSILDGEFARMTPTELNGRCVLRLILVAAVTPSRPFGKPDSFPTAQSW